VGGLLRLSGLLLLLLCAPRGAGAADWERAAALALEAGGPARLDALRAQVDLGLAEGRDEAWACLDLWLKAEWEDSADLPAAREAFWREWPCSSCQDAADWWTARWLLRREGAAAAAPRLLRLAAARPHGEWGQRAAELLESLEAQDALPAGWPGSLDEAGRAWWAARRAARDIHGHLLLLAPLSGADAAVGAAVRMAVEEALAGRSDVSLTVWDNQSDALLTREQLDLSRRQSVDAVLLPGLPAYLAALPGLELDRPVVALGYEGPPPADLHPRLLHFGLDPATLGAQAARLALDSLGAARLASLGPATRAAMRAVDGFRAEASRSMASPPGEKQWYFHGARQLDHQRSALCGQVEGGPGAWLLLGSAREGAVLADLLAAMPGARWIGRAPVLGVGLAARLPGRAARRPAPRLGRVSGARAPAPRPGARGDGIPGL